MMIALDASPTLTPELLERAAHTTPLAVELTPNARSAVERSHAALKRILASGTPVYGITTGFGPLVRYGTTMQHDDADGIGLIAHLEAGYGEPVRTEVVRAAVILRLQTLARGYSGISLRTLEHYARLLERETLPDIPSVGSLGASGDLIPLAHLVRALHDDSKRRDNNHTTELSSGICGRDALALVNGTSFSTAFAALALVRSERLIERLEELTGWIMRLMGCRRSGLDARLHRAKAHKGQILSAENIAREAGCGAIVQEDPARPLQEIYSLRCAPQILGAVRDVMQSARAMIQQEMNGIDDNPVVCANAQDVVHGGNFMTQHIAFAADMLNNAITQAGNLAERQIYALLHSETSKAPLLLAFEPGRTSGMAGVQLTATAIVAEMRARARCYAASTLPTNAGNQDIVPMGLQASREAFEQTERLAGILACQILCCVQLLFLTREGRTEYGRILSQTRSDELVQESVAPPEYFEAMVRDIAPLREDRALRREIAVLTQRILAEGKV